MSLVVGRHWSFMTPDYIYNEMTPSELSDAMEYVQLYELNERHYSAGVFKRNKKLWEWYKREVPDVDKQFKTMLRKMKADGVK